MTNSPIRGVPLGPFSLYLSDSEPGRLHVPRLSEDGHKFKSARKNNKFCNRTSPFISCPQPSYRRFLKKNLTVYVFLFGNICSM